MMTFPTHRLSQSLWTRSLVVLVASLWIAAGSGLAAIITLESNQAKPPEIATLERAAGNGSGEAALKLAKHLAAGQVIPRDLGAAEKWFRRAVDAQVMEARTPLAGVLLETSNEGAAVDRAAEGLRLLRTAAADNDPKAFLTLGMLYASGRFLSPDFSQAAAHFAKAAELGDNEGWYRLGWLHAGEAGFLEQAEPEKSLEMLEKGFREGNLAAGQLLVRMLNEGARVPRDEARAFGIVKSAAEAGNVEARFFLGELYEQGKGTAADPALAFEAYRSAANEGMVQAQNRVGLIFLRGNEAVEADADSARSWFEKAAQQGSPVSHYNLGLLFASEAEEDPTAVRQAVDHLVAAANRGFVPAQDRLGAWYRDGRYVSQDVVAATAWFRLAANAGYVDAKLNLAHLLDSVSPEPNSRQTAFNLYREAASAGHSMGHFHLARYFSSGVLGRVDLVSAYAHLLAASGAGLPLATEALPQFNSVLSDAEKQAAAEQAGQWKVAPWQEVSPDEWTPAEGEPVAGSAVEALGQESP